MKNKINILIIFILITFFCMTLTSCKNDELNSSLETSEKSSKNNVQFNLDLENGKLEAEINYLKNEGDLLGTEFLLNRDFVINELICDGEKIDSEKIKELINYYEGYSVNLYKLPKFENELKINYTGFLRGNTGSSPYVTEKISKDFTFLRWETFCYPIFADNFEHTLKFLTTPLSAEIIVNVPKGYSAPAPFKLVEKIENSNSTSFVYDGRISDFNCSIAKYNILSLPYGDFYFLENMNVNELSDFITPIMEKTHKYMDNHFGKFNISADTDMKYIVIPDKMGAFAPGGAIFVEESSFKSVLDMGGLIHEFIHLGWNPKTEEFEVQRTRFFDEGFTSYFTNRVLGNLLGEETYLSQMKKIKKRYKSIITEDETKFIPISDYAKYEYGDLSYITGPIFLDELCKTVGTEMFDKATEIFIKKYKDTPVDFKIMCTEYIELCNNPELESFFQDWLFTTNGYKQYIE